jgi:hypothetical protein
MSNLPNTPTPQPAPARSGGSGKLLLIGAIGCLGVLLLCGCIIAGAFTYFAASSPTAITSSSSVARGDGTVYTNEAGHLNASLRANFVPFTFEYPSGWNVVSRGDAADDSNFVKIEKQDASRSTIANFAVGWFSGAGTLARDKTLYASLADQLSEQFSAGFSNFTKTGSGSVTINDYDAYQMLFTARVTDPDDKSVTPILGRVILISGGNAGLKNGVVLVMLATDKSGMTDPSQLGESGDLGTILDSFELGK